MNRDEVRQLLKTNCGPCINKAHAIINAISDGVTVSFLYTPTSRDLKLYKDRDEKLVCVIPGNYMSMTLGVAVELNTFIRSIGSTTQNPAA